MDEAAKVEEAAPEYVKNVLRNHFKKKMRDLGTYESSAMRSRARAMAARTWTGAVPPM